MANRLAMDVAAGLSKADPSVVLGEIDPRDVHVGVDNPWADTPGGSDHETYNRKALPWEGGAYTFVGGDLVKVGGRPNALDGPQIERRYPNMTSVWNSFASAQGNRESNPGSLAQLRSDLVRVAQNISSPGQLNPAQGEGSSLRALKASRRGR